jgi:hypothetical protein
MKPAKNAQKNNALMLVRQMFINGRRKKSSLILKDVSNAELAVLSAVNLTISAGATRAAALECHISMDKIFVQTIILLTFFCNLPSAAIELKAPSFADSEKIIYQCINKNDHAKRWEVQVDLTKNQQGEKIFLEQIEIGQGMSWKNKENGNWTTTSMFEVNSSIYQIFSKREFNSESGKKSFENKKFDFENNRAFFGGKMLKINKEYIGQEGLGILMRSFIASGLKKYSFHLLTNEPAKYKMDLKLLCIENITVPAGTFECYKIQMSPDLGLLKIATVFIPPTYFWYTTNSPHFFIRYEGLESGLGTPYVVMELLNREEE